MRARAIIDTSPICVRPFSNLQHKQTDCAENEIVSCRYFDSVGRLAVLREGDWREAYVFGCLVHGYDERRKYFALYSLNIGKTTYKQNKKSLKQKAPTQ